MYIALYKDGRYSKEKVVDGHIEVQTAEEKFAQVYYIWAKTWYNVNITEQFLESLNIPNLGYIKTNVGFEVYDKSKAEYTEEVLPIYVDVFGSIKKTNKSIVFKTPTKTAIEASKNMFENIEKELVKLKYKKDISIIREKLEKGNGIAYINTRVEYIPNFSTALYSENVKILFCLNSHYIIGNVAKMPILELYVPEKIVPMIIGKGGKQIKKIAEEIGARRINVRPIQG